MLLCLMGVVLVMTAAIPHAFDDRAVVFAAAFVSLQVGRTVFVLITLGRNHELSPNFTRMLAWLLVSAALWAGGASGRGLGSAISLGRRGIGGIPGPDDRLCLSRAGSFVNSRMDD